MKTKFECILPEITPDPKLFQAGQYFINRFDNQPFIFAHVDHLRMNLICLSYGSRQSDSIAISSDDLGISSKRFYNHFNGEYGDFVPVDEVKIIIP